MKCKIKSQEIYLTEKEMEITQEKNDAIAMVGNEHSEIDKVEKVSFADVKAIMEDEGTDYDFLHRHSWQTWAEFIKESIEFQCWAFGKEAKRVPDGYRVTEMTVTE